MTNTNTSHNEAHDRLPTMGSLFDGSGGFMLAGKMSGFRPVWASEVEPYPIAVTKYRFPEVAHLGDISKINGGNIQPVDLITFGSPCQNMSIAGDREGIKHEGIGDSETTRSGLFYDAVRVMKEMKDKSGGEYPKYALWENVPGALSCNHGEDFRTVLELLCEVCEGRRVFIPRPTTKWTNAGVVMGDGYSIAWKILDARYFGVPQRRRRIFLVVDFRGQRAEQILFEPKGGERDICKGEEEESKHTDGHGTRTVGNNVEGGQLASYKVYDARGRGNGRLCPPLLSDHENRVTDYTSIVVKSMGNGETHQLRLNDVCSPLTCMHDQQAIIIKRENEQNVCDYEIRRLMPCECARLQGFPSDWGKIPTIKDMNDSDVQFWESVRETSLSIKGKRYQRYTSRQAVVNWYNKLRSDASEYKMWGNGIALPCALYVVNSIANYMKDSSEDN